MKTILLVCTGNTCRSPIAKLLLEKMFLSNKLTSYEECKIISAGISAVNGLSASTTAIQAMQGEGFDLSEHRSVYLDGGIAEDADLILTMTMAQKHVLRNKFPYKKEKIVTFAEWSSGTDEDIDDPFGRGLEEYRKTVQQIRSLIIKKMERQADCEK